MRNIVSNIRKKLRAEFEEFFAEVGWNNKVWIAEEDIILSVTECIGDEFTTLPEDVVFEVFHEIFSFECIKDKRTIRNNLPGRLLSRWSEGFDERYKEYHGTLSGQIIGIDNQLNFLDMKLRRILEPHCIQSHKRRTYLDSIIKENNEYVTQQMNHTTSTQTIMEEFDGWNADDVICVSDLFIQSPHKHIFEKELEFYNNPVDLF